MAEAAREIVELTKMLPLDEVLRDLKLSIEAVKLEVSKYTLLTLCMTSRDGFRNLLQRAQFGDLDKTTARDFFEQLHKILVELESEKLDELSSKFLDSVRKRAKWCNDLLGI